MFRSSYRANTEENIGIHRLCNTGSIDTYNFLMNRNSVTYKSFVPFFDQGFEIETFSNIGD